MLDKDLLKYFPGNPKQVKNINISYKRIVDENLISSIDNFIHKSLEDFSLIGLNKIIVGLSGGADSVITAALLKRAIGDRASVVIVDFALPNDNATLAIESANKIGIDYTLIQASKLFNEHLKILKDNSKLSQIHLRSRLVNNIIFQVADNIGAAVAETTNKSETLLNLYAESFRGHIALLSDIYKSELYDIGDYLNLPELRERQSGCPDLIDIDAFGMDWDVLDPIIHLLAEDGVEIHEIARSFDLDIDWLTNLQKRITQQSIRTRTNRLFLPAHTQ